MDTKLLDQMNDQEKYERRLSIQDSKDLAILLEARKMFDRLYPR